MVSGATRVRLACHTQQEIADAEGLPQQTVADALKVSTDFGNLAESGKAAANHATALDAEKMYAAEAAKRKARRERDEKGRLTAQPIIADLREQGKKDRTSSERAAKVTGTSGRGVSQVSRYTPSTQTDSGPGGAPTPLPRP